MEDGVVRSKFVLLKQSTQRLAKNTAAENSGKTNPIISKDLQIGFDWVYIAGINLM